MTIKHIDHLNLTVSDLQQSIDWYQRVFGFELVEEAIVEGVPHAIIRSGESMLALYEHRALSSAHTDLRQHRIKHFAFRVQDPQAWLNTVKREQLALGYGGEVRYPASRSWYVRDPTGYEIEVVAWDDDRIRFRQRSA